MQPGRSGSEARGGVSICRCPGFRLPSNQATRINRTDGVSTCCVTCIGVDPYYLTHKAEMLGYHPQVILAGRRINDGMVKYIAEQTIKQMIASGSYIKGARVNVLGLTFKENCADLRNSKVVDIINELKSYGAEVFVHDPEADADEAMHEYGVRLLAWDDLQRAGAIVAAVAHKQYRKLSTEEICRKLIKGGCFVDVKSGFSEAELRGNGLKVWRL